MLRVLAKRGVYPWLGGIGIHERRQFLLRVCAPASVVSRLFPLLSLREIMAVRARLATEPPFSQRLDARALP